MDKCYDLFIEQGAASTEQRQPMQARLKAILEDAEKDVPVSGDEARQLRENLRETLLKLAEVEKVAITALEDAIA